MLKIRTEMDPEVKEAINDEKSRLSKILNLDFSRFVEVEDKFNANIKK